MYLLGGQADLLGVLREVGERARGCFLFGVVESVLKAECLGSVWCRANITVRTVVGAHRAVHLLEVEFSIQDEGLRRLRAPTIIDGPTVTLFEGDLDAETEPIRLDATAASGVSRG